jgi:hypothetical protein
MGILPAITSSILDRMDLRGKVAVVTGATGGIGEVGLACLKCASCQNHGCVNFVCQRGTQGLGPLSRDHMKAGDHSHDDV